MFITTATVTMKQIRDDHYKIDIADIKGPLIASFVLFFYCMWLAVTFHSSVHSTHL